MHLKDIFLEGGPVMWPLLAFSIATVAMTVERSVFWVKLLKAQSKIIQQVKALYRSDPALAIEKLGRHLDLPVSRIFHGAMSLEDADTEEFALAIDESIQAELPGLRRFNDIFDLIVGLAPLFGLLGTVMGLIRSFSDLNVGAVDSSKTANVTSGIGEALIATAFGLMVAIAAFIVASLFRSLYTRQVALIQENVAGLERLYRRRSKALVKH